MLRTIYFYGTGGGALTFLDPVQGVAVTRIPTVGSKDTVALRGVVGFCDTPTVRDFINIKVGSEGDYHDIQILPISDANNFASDLGTLEVQPLGDVEVKENSALSGTATGTGDCTGMIMFEDGEPEIPMPEGRHVFLTSISSGDATTSLAVTNIAQPNASKALSVDSKYYAYAVTVFPQDSMIQAFIMRDSDGRCACGPSKGRMVFPSCPLVVDGNSSPAVLAQVLAVTEAWGIWEFVEVPKGGSASISSGTAVKSGLAFGGSLRKVVGGGGASLFGGGGFGFT